MGYLQAIRDRWPRKLIIKGLLDRRGHCSRRRDRRRRGGDLEPWRAAARLGGGAARYLLPAARQAVGDRITLFVDGGIRRGTDVIKMLALGADAVLAGRAVLYGVAAGGKDGAKHALDILREEIVRDLGLLGVPSIAELSPSLAPAPGNIGGLIRRAGAEATVGGNGRLRRRAAKPDQEQHQAGAERQYHHQREIVDIGDHPRSGSWLVCPLGGVG